MTKASRRRKKHLWKQRQNVGQRVSCPISPWKIRRFFYDDFLCTVGRAPRLYTLNIDEFLFLSYYNYLHLFSIYKESHERQKHFSQFLLNTWLFQQTYSSEILAISTNAFSLYSRVSSWSFLSRCSENERGLSYVHEQPIENLYKNRNPQKWLQNSVRAFRSVNLLSHTVKVATYFW